MLLNEIIKNIKLIARNWSSLLLLILGPLAMMLIIGLTFGADTPHGIILGVHGDDSFQLPSTDFADPIAFDTLDECVESVGRGDIHLCLDVQQPDDKQVRVTFLFDPSEKKLSNLIIASIKEVLGAQAQDISLLATQSLIDQVVDLVGFLQERDADLEVVVQEANATREQLAIRLDRLKSVQAQLDKPRTALANLATLANTTANLTSSARIAQAQLESALFATRLVLPVAQPPIENISGVNQANLSIVFDLNDNSTIIANITDPNAQSALILWSMTQARDAAVATASLGRIADKQAQVQSDLIRNASEQVNTVFRLLDDEVRFNEEAIRKIDIATNNIAEVRASFSASINNLAVSDPSLAKAIANPIVEQFSSIKDISNVQGVFPGLVVIVIVFITLLFSTILTLQEIHSAAYFRNLIAPVSPALYTVGLLITNILLVLFQVTVLFIIGHFQLGTSIFTHWPSVYALVLCLAFIFSLVGTFVAFSIKGEHSAVLTTTFVALGFYLFSNLVTPLEIMPQTVAQFARFNPVVIGEQALRKLILFDVPIDTQVYVLLAVAAVIGILLLVFAQSRFIRKLR